MKIAFIGQKGIPAISGGVEKNVEEIAIRLAQMGHEVFVYVRDNYTDAALTEWKGVKLIHIPAIQTKHLEAITHTLFATIHALFSTYDVIHYQAIGPSSLSFLARIFKPRTAIISTFHCQDYFHQKWGLLARLYLRLGEKIACTFPDKTIVVSKTLKEYAFYRHGAETIVISNGANTIYNPNIDRLSEWNLRDKKYVLSVSRLIKHKGIHYLMEAFKQLEDTNKLPNNMKLVIVGEGSHTDEYVEYLKAISRGRDNIIFTGRQSGEALEQLFSHAYTFVQPSESEGMSISLLEAMHYGLPVISSNIKENMEVVEDSGLQFENKNVEDLKKKLAYILNNPTEASLIAKKARKRAEDEYSWDSSAKKTADVYASAIKIKKG